MEQKAKIKVFTAGLSLFLFFIGGMIYLMFRSESLVMFRWCETLHIREYVDSVRISCTLPNWIVYSLPDGLMQGTFDWMDMVCYILGLLSGYVIIEYLFKIKR